MPTTQNRSYRCTYTPKDRDGWPVACETGVLPFIDLKAPDAEAAQRAAHKRTGCSITEVQRIELTTEQVLAAAERKANPRRFTGAPITGFGALA